MTKILRSAAWIIAAVSLAGCADDSQPKPSARTVVTIRAASAALEASDRFPATLRADDRGRLGFELGGQIQRVNVDIGDRFGQGQLLASLNGRQQQLGVESATAQVSQARATAREAAIDFQRKADLAGTGAVSEAEIDASRRRRDETVAQVRALDAQRGQASDQLADTRLHAPFAGIVTARLAEPSEVIGAGEAVLEVSGLKAGLEAVITVPASQRDAFTNGRSYLFTPRLGAPRPAIVEQVSPAAGSTGLFEVVLRIPNARETGLAEGERGEIVLQAEGERGIILPLSALRMRRDNRATVMIVDPQTNRAIAREVALGPVGDSGIIILRGLREGEIVVTKGARLLRAGEQVRPAGEGPRRYNQ